MQIDSYYCHILMKLEFSRQTCEKYSNKKFNENLYSGSRAVPCGRINGRIYGQTDRCTDMTNLIFTFRSFVNVTKHRLAERSRLLQTAT